MSFSTNNRSTIDSEVYKWVAQQLKKKKVVTPNAIRQKALEIGQEFDPNFKASINWYNNWKKRFDYNESPEAEALKRKKRSYTASFKLHAVQRTMELESASQASLELDVSRRCLQRWKEELDIISSVAEHSSNAVYRRPGQGRKVRDMSLDTQLLDWVKECWKQGISLSSGMIREKARELSPHVSGHAASALGKRALETAHPPGTGEDQGESSRGESTSEFKASLGWFIKWQKRHCVDLKEQTCSPSAGEVTTPLKLRLLPEGEVSAYSTPKKRRVSKKQALSYDDTALLENDEEFDRLLLTWLVERWEAGDIVNDKMLKERALELTANPDFKASKVWLQAWKGKYNVSLENQTYGTDGDEENEEIIEEMQVYDEQVVVEGEPQPPATGEGSSENPMAPTKEEAATALASLSADDHEIAEALQKLANAFGIAQSGGAKEAVSQLAALQQNDNPAFLLETTGQVAVEEVISEEVVTDDPMVVIEGTSVAESAPYTSATAVAETNMEDISSSTVQSIVDVVSAATQIAQSITGSSNPSVTQPVAESLIQAVANQLSHSSTQSTTSDLAMQLQQDEGGTGVETLAMAPTQAPTQQTPSTSLSVTTTDVVQTVQTGTSALDQFVSEEVIISEPVETSVASGGPTGTIFETTVSEGVIGGQMEVLVQGGGGEVVMPEDHSDTIVQLSSEKTEGVEISAISMPPVSSANQIISEIMITSTSGDVPPAHMISTTPAEIQVVSTGEPDSEVITSTGTEIITSMGTDILAPGGTAGVEVSLSQEISIPQGGHDILDVVQETVMGEGEGKEQEEREYDRDFKARVMRRAAELGSVQQAAREFSIPWKVVASWNTQD